MKKIFAVVLLVAGLVLISGCTYRSEREESQYYNTLIRGAVYHNQIVLFTQNEKILENQELIIEQQRHILKILGYVRAEQLDGELNERR